MKNILKSKNLKLKFDKSNVNALLFYTVILLLILALKLLFFNLKSSDYILFLSKWWEQIENFGWLNSLNYKIGDYPDSYMFILSLGVLITKNSLIYIKIISCIFDLVIFIFGYKILNYFNKNIAIKYSWIFLIIPGIILNSSVLGQCDSIYSCFVLIFIYYILKNKPKIALLSLGIALSFKLQASFICPIVIYLLLTKKIKIVDILFIPIGFIIPFIPTCIFGKGLIENFKILLFQTLEYKQIVKSCPNIYSLLFLNYRPVNTIIKYVLSSIVILIAIYISIPKSHSKFSDKTFMNKLLVLSLVVPFLLPSMMDRYFYLSNIIVTLYFLITNNKFKEKYIILFSIIYFLPVLSINLSNSIYIDYIIVSVICSFPNLLLILKVLKESEFFLLTKKS